MSRRLHAKVFGLVQGVGFRAYVARVAQSLSLTGYAKNLSDGSVEVVAEGDEERVKNLLASLRQGPSFASVDRVEWQIVEAEPNYRWFSVE